MRSDEPLLSLALGREGQSRAKLTSNRRTCVRRWFLVLPWLVNEQTRGEVGLTLPKSFVAVGDFNSAGAPISVT